MIVITHCNDENGDPLSCSTSGVTNGGNDGTNGTGAGPGEGNDPGGDTTTSGTGGGIPGGGSGSCSYSGIYVMGCGGSDSDRLHPIGTCGGNVAIASRFAVWDCGGGATTRTTSTCTNCPDDNNEVLINDNPTCPVGNVVDGDGNCINSDDDKIENLLTGKALCIYNKLKSSSTGFKNAIKKFDGEFPVSHLKFELKDLGNTRGRTVAPNSNPNTPNSPDYVITIYLNNNSNIHGVNYRPNLMVAKTIAHEIIHAEMYRKLLSVLDNGGTLTGVTRQDILDALNDNYPGLYDYYRRYRNWQHAQMATHYRETLARILQEYDTGIAVSDNQQPQQLYMNLAWEGLRYPDIPTWSDLPQVEKDRINDLISEYITDNQNQTCTE